MKAIIWPKYSPPEVLQLEEVDEPAPADNELLIKVVAANVFPGDCEMRRFQMHPSLWLPIRIFMGIRKPRLKILGQELAGEIEAVGKDVTRFKSGDQVFGATAMKLGAYAEYVCLPENYVLALKPDDVSYEEASTLAVGGIHALHFLRKGNVKSGERILIYGAGGCIGTYAVQLAKLLGAEVTTVDSASKLDMLSDIGADHVIDYAEEDFSNNGIRYDVIFDVVGKSSYSRSLYSLQANGRYLMANVGLSVILRGLWTSRFGDKKVIFALANLNSEDLVYLSDLLVAGKIKSVIDRCYPLAQAADAHSYIESGCKQGHVVLTVA